MEKKILLVTLEGSSNFGNRLQHYALQQACEACGCSVDSLMLRQEKTIPMLKRKNVVKTLLVLVGQKKYRESLSKSRRAVKLLDFNRKWLTRCLHLKADALKRTDWSSYDYAVTGSDQVWHNWHFTDISDELSVFYLEFMEEKKRISYAPSFGFTTFPPEDLEQHRRGLMGMRALSCREREGCELIRELTGREAVKVLDPTLLLTAVEWAAIEKKPTFKLKTPYLLQFFLGETGTEYRTEIVRIARERGLRIVDIGNLNDPKHYAVSPNEFIWLMHHADTVCTDSFHASVFSVLFERNLRVFRRKQEGMEDMFGRLHDLLEPLGLLCLVYGEGEGISTALSKDAKAYLASERERSMDYLKRSLGTEERNP